MKGVFLTISFLLICIFNKNYVYIDKIIGIIFFGFIAFIILLFLAFIIDFLSMISERRIMNKHRKNKRRSKIRKQIWCK